MKSRRSARLTGWVIGIVAVFVLYDIYQHVKTRLGFRPTGGPPPMM